MRLRAPGALLLALAWPRLSTAVVGHTVVVDLADTTASEHTIDLKGISSAHALLNARNDRVQLDLGRSGCEVEGVSWDGVTGAPDNSGTFGNEMRVGIRDGAGGNHKGSLVIFPDEDINGAWGPKSAAKVKLSNPFHMIGGAK